MPELENPNPPVPDPAKPPENPPAYGLTREELNQILDERFNQILSKIAPAEPVKAEPSKNGASVLDQVAEEFAKEEKLEPDYAKRVVGRFAKIVEHMTQGTQAELNQFKLRDKFVQVFAANPDSEKLAPKMQEIFKSLTALEQNFVMHSPDGGQWLYDKAARATGLYSQPPEVRLAASPSGGRGPSPESKLGGKEMILNDAADALSKGDRAGYDAKMQQILRG